MILLCREFRAIAAMAENGVIGNQGKIPWHLPLDFRWFKHKTMGDTLLMGRKTYESIGHPLPGRKTIVLSRNPTLIPGVEICSDWESLQHPKVESAFSPIWVCGGAEIYRQLLPFCAELYLTRVKGEFSGDAYFTYPENYQLKHILYEDDKMRVELHKNRESRSQRYSYDEAWPFPPM